MASNTATSTSKAIASDAYIYGYAMLYNYKTMFQQAVDPSFPGYIGGFGRFRHYSRGFTPADADIEWRLARALVKMQSLDEARRTLDNAVRQHPRDAAGSFRGGTLRPGPCTELHRAVRR